MFTEADALNLRSSASKLYSFTKTALHTAVVHALREFNIEPDDDTVERIVERVWQLSTLDDVFHDLGSLGYRQLIKDGWSPFKDPDDDWKGGKPVAYFDS